MIIYVFRVALPFAAIIVVVLMFCHCYRYKLRRQQQQEALQARQSIQLHAATSSHPRPCVPATGRQLPEGAYPKQQYYCTGSHMVGCGAEASVPQAGYSFTAPPMYSLHEPSKGPPSYDDVIATPSTDLAEATPTQQ